MKNADAEAQNSALPSLNLVNVIEATQHEDKYYSRNLQGSSQPWDSSDNQFNLVNVIETIQHEDKDDLDDLYLDDLYHCFLTGHRTGEAETTGFCKGEVKGVQLTKKFKKQYIAKTNSRRLWKWNSWDNYKKEEELVIVRDIGPHIDGENRVKIHKEEAICRMCYCNLIHEMTVHRVSCKCKLSLIHEMCIQKEVNKNCGFCEDVIKYIPVTIQRATEADDQLSPQRSYSWSSCWHYNKNRL